LAVTNLRADRCQKTSYLDQRPQTSKKRELFNQHVFNPKGPQRANPGLRRAGYTTTTSLIASRQFATMRSIKAGGIGAASCGASAERCLSLSTSSGLAHPRLFGQGGWFSPARLALSTTTTLTPLSASLFDDLLQPCGVGNLCPLAALFLRFCKRDRNPLRPLRR